MIHIISAEHVFTTRSICLIYIEIIGVILTYPKSVPRRVSPSNSLRQTHALRLQFWSKKITFHKTIPYISITTALDKSCSYFDSGQQNRGLFIEKFNQINSQLKLLKVYQMIF